MLRSKSGCYPEILGKWRFKRTGKNLSARLANVQSWGLGSAASPLVGSRCKAQEAQAILRYLKPENS